MKGGGTDEGDLDWTDDRFTEVTRFKNAESYAEALEILCGNDLSVVEAGIALVLAVGVAGLGRWMREEEWPHAALD